MEEQVEHLVGKTWKTFHTIDDGHRLLIAIAGVPGSGKTTFAATVASRLNKLHHSEYHSQHPSSPEVTRDHPDPSQPDIAIALPLDGYHLTRKQLSELPNSEEAIFRRGAAFTFDGDAYLKLVKRLRKPLEAGDPTIHAPSFDHAIKDPVSDDIAIHPTTRIILLEGNYVALNKPPWSDAAKLMDEIWFVDVSIPAATERLVMRHVASGISPDAVHARKRVMESDMRNGKEIVNARLDVQEIIKSVDDQKWKSDDLKRMEAEKEREDEQEGRPQAERTDSIAQMASDGCGL